MVHREFRLKHSRISIVFQLMIILLIVFVIYQLLTILVLIFSVVVLALSFLRFNQKVKVEYFAYLDDDIWSLKYKNNNKVYRVRSKNVLNYQLYVVVELSQSEHKSFIVWYDQLDEKQWKKLKTLSLLN